MNITPQHVAAVYEMLRQFKPFDRWKLPESDAIGFHIRNIIGTHGKYQHDGKTHNITISSALVDSPYSLIDTTAHEVIHLYQEIRGTDNKSQHNAEFRRLASQVCRAFMWDCKRFIG